MLLSDVLSLVFIVKCYSKSLLLRIKIKVVEKKHEYSYHGQIDGPAQFFVPSILFTFGRMGQGTIWPKFISSHKFHWTASKN